jgi:hypothetical protein
VTDPLLQSRAAVSSGASLTRRAEPKRPGRRRVIDAGRGAPGNRSERGFHGTHVRQLHGAAEATCSWHHAYSASYIGVSSSILVWSALLCGSANPWAMA